MNGREAVKALMDGETVYPITEPALNLKLEGSRIKDDQGGSWSVPEVLEIPSTWRLCIVPTPEKYPYGTIVEALCLDGIWNITYSLGEMRNNCLLCSSALSEETAYPYEHVRAVNTKTNKEQ